VSGKEPFILVVAANPKPRNRLAFENPDSPITPGDSDGPNLFFMIDALKPQRGMKGIVCP
jgi:hypothetical protein